MFLSIASSNKTQKDDSGVFSLILVVANAVGPGLMLSAFCCCNTHIVHGKQPKLARLFRLFQSSSDLPALDSVDHCNHLS